MWLLIVLVLLVILIYYEIDRETPSCSGNWQELALCLDYNHNPVHWTRCAIVAILSTLLILCFLSCLTLRNFILVFLILFVGSYFSANWLSAHFNRNVDYKIEPFVENLRYRINLQKI
ncbi:putative membrane protein [Cedratvirus kamchatka]|uniref:Membrane protein n=1 Tax=Cedratvirus kamchatka TaxID=2716914 RepID=A0A6G8MXA7_9VIRU|nr:putative membrane protein [Cedratvirus kamchatka]WIL03955.1 putative membrane protein [Cedratvirus lena]WIL04538.1 putative membrane protein [Cedratvirus duvanny]